MDIQEIYGFSVKSNIFGRYIEILCHRLSKLSQIVSSPSNYNILGVFENVLIRLLGKGILKFYFHFFPIYLKA